MVQKIPTSSPTTTTLAPMNKAPHTIATENIHAQRYKENVLFDDKQLIAHPSVVCFIHGDIAYKSTQKKSNMKPKATKRVTGSYRPVVNSFKQKRKRRLGSHPFQENTPPKPTKVVRDNTHKYSKNETCKYPKPPNHVTTTSITPSTCNAIHSLGFNYHMFDNRDHPSN